MVNLRLTNFSHFSDRITGGGWGGALFFLSHTGAQVDPLFLSPSGNAQAEVYLLPLGDAHVEPLSCCLYTMRVLFFRYRRCLRGVHLSVAFRPCLRGGPFLFPPGKACAEPFSLSPSGNAQFIHAPGSAQVAPFLLHAIYLLINFIRTNYQPSPLRDPYMNEDPVNPFVIHFKRNTVLNSTKKKDITCTQL
jgi:hypothetical protein